MSSPARTSRRKGNTPFRAPLRRPQHTLRARPGSDGDDRAQSSQPDHQRRAGSPVARARFGRSPGDTSAAARTGRFFDRPAFAGSRAEAPTSKLQKRLAEAGLGSRRAMEELIQSGKVSVNGRVARLGVRVGAGDRITIGGEPLAEKRVQRIAREPRVVLYHKAEGEIVSRRDPEGRPSVFDRVPVVQRGRWLAVGRLDFNTCGLLVFTDSGELANRLTHPRFRQPRDYAVRIVGELTSEQMRSLRSGIALEDGPAQFELLEPQGGEGTNRWYRVRVREGRNRLVRRMFAATGMTVSRLMRTGFGPFELPPRLKRGQWLRLDPQEVRRALQKLQVAGEETIAPQRPHSGESQPQRHDRRGPPPARVKRPRVPRAAGNDAARTPHRPRRPARAR